MNIVDPHKPVTMHTQKVVNNTVKCFFLQFVQDFYNVHTRHIPCAVYSEIKNTITSLRDIDSNVWKLLMDMLCWPPLVLIY